ncbi:glycosyltransferase [Bdellovibrio reynosensis]|uniref:Glycosyltransferase n=1 Tax=Bdellovibrio reynosensis TaxID=2835041 RepID=A0ABY4CBB2_9BACT|nr:glycosyltransferase [Bdellovibrio reynosensis]UOF02232.1 glycosyltransferase [Bdellovibrio reynosensis]
MTILILAEAYPSINSKAMSYVHSRSLYYKSLGHDVTVINFKAHQKYTYEGILVIPEADFSNKQNYEIVCAHAPNLKNHIRFLIRHSRLFKKIVFFFHGHEVLRKKNYYNDRFKFTPNPNNKTFNLKGLINSLIGDLYDLLKLKFLRLYFKKLINGGQGYFVSVSDWMYSELKNNLRVNDSFFGNKHRIIHNCANSVFQEFTYKKPERPEADFITIRPFDSPKYCLDIVFRLAQIYPEYKFHVYGSGNFFELNKPPQNLKFFIKDFSQKEMPELLNNYRFALMPTRLDSQGVMVCEMATYGMPVITSNISIAKEMLSDFNRVYFLDNERPRLDANLLSQTENQEAKSNQKFSLKYTIGAELDFFMELVHEKP